MTRDEHRNIIAFMEEVARQGDLAHSPLDVEADAIIRALFVRNPEAAYRVTKLAMAQREELVQLKAELAARGANSGKGWFSRLLKKSQRRGRGRRLDPSFSMFPQNIRSR